MKTRILSQGKDVKAINCLSATITITIKITAPSSEVFVLKTGVLELINSKDDDIQAAINKVVSVYIQLPTECGPCLQFAMHTRRGD